MGFGIGIDGFPGPGYKPATMAPKTPSLAAGLAALGLLWPAMPCVARQAAPSAPAAASTPSPSPSAPRPSVILLSNGQVLRGELREDDAGLVVMQKLGPIHLQKRQVEGSFAAIDGVYRYKLERLAKEDPDERMKLARWCLKEGLKAEARDQLASVLALVDSHPQARSMLAMLDAEAQRAPAPRDDAVKQAGVEIRDDGRPGKLDPGVLGMKERRAQVLTPPVIFDLPLAVAARRYQEFVNAVHPKLQQHCAGCHNEKGESSFQLMKVATLRDKTDPLLLRTNLDATLRLVNAEKPAESKLLTSAIMPHGKLNRPVLSGPNNASYQALAHWVQGLQAAPRPADPGVAPAAFNPRPAAAPAVGGFAADRVPAAPIAPKPAMATAPAAGPEGPGVAHPDVPAGADFRTVTPLLGSGPNTATIATPAKPAAQPAQNLPPELKPLTAKDLDKLDSQRKSPRRFDPSLMQKVISGRNAGP